MRILHLSRTMGQGGAEKVVYQLALDEKKRGKHVVVVSSGGLYEKPLREQNISHYKVHDLECKNPFIILRTLCFLIKIIKKEKITILHMHHRMAAFYGWIIKVLFPNIGYVYTAHNVFFNKKKLTNLTLRHMHIVAVGEGVKENLESFFGISSSQIQVIYNAIKIDEEAIDTKELITLKEWRKQGFSIIGVVGRLSEQKGMDVFIRAFAKAKETNPFIKGVMIGDGELREKLQMMLCTYGLQSDIRMVGYQKYPSSFIRELDFVVMPSRWEGFPLTPLEVFSVGKSLIASDIDGINEIVRHGENGWLVKKEDVEGFSAAMLQFLEDTSMTKRFGENGKAYYNAHFSFEQFSEAYHAVYKRVRKEHTYENLDYHTRKATSSRIKRRCS